ncbi:MAG: hypothetical protein MZV65_31275 [Chromatiales bacterium]|nr:hypothetical protein [Chromatiales bacterium]
MLIAIIAAVYFIGLPMLTDNGGFSAHSNPPAAEITPIPTYQDNPPADSDTHPASRALVPLPTQADTLGPEVLLPGPEKSDYFKDLGHFRRKCGEGSIRSADIKVTHPDGSVATGIILPLKGVTEITLEGSKETDRVEIIAQMSSGETYRVYDELIPAWGNRSSRDSSRLRPC